MSWEWIEAAIFERGDFVDAEVAVDGVSSVSMDKGRPANARGAERRDRMFPKVADQVANPSSSLVGNAETAVDAELPVDSDL